MQQKFTNPYNFVPVEKPADSKKRQHWLSENEFSHRQLNDYSHAKYHSNTHSGRIVCRLTTESAIFIGASSKPDEQKKEPAKAEPFELEGKPAIPASTLRGLLSSIVESASHSSLRVLHDQVLSYRQKMGEGLPAIGRVLLKENEEGKQDYYLKPLALPILEKLEGGGGYTYGTENEQEKQAYLTMFGRKARLKVYVKGYDKDDNPINFLKDKKTFTEKEFYYARLREHKFVKEHGMFILPSVRDDSLHGTRGGHVDAQNVVDNSPIITEAEWRDKPIEEKKLYTRDIGERMNVHYSVLIQWSDEDQCYIASLPEFGPYTHTHGESYEEALKNAKEVLALLTEDMSPLPNPHIYRVAEALAA